MDQKWSNIKLKENDFKATVTTKKHKYPCQNNNNSRHRIIYLGTSLAQVNLDLAWMCKEDKCVCVLIPRGFNEGSQTQVVVIWFWRLVQQMGRGWPEDVVHYIAPSFKWVGVCAQRALFSVFRQTDSWSNRLRRAVGSLGSDLSPLGPLYSSLVNSKFKTIFIVLWLGVPGGAPCLFVQTGVWNLFCDTRRQQILWRNQKRFFMFCPVPKCLSPCLLLWLSVTGCAVRAGAPSPCPCVYVWVCVV